MKTAEIERDLQEKKASLEARLAKTSAHFRNRKVAVSANLAEQVVETQDDELIKNLEVELKIELGAIETALRRISSGTYQTCSHCGGHISEARLAALPYTNVCIDCAKFDK